jgi:hypothetical protein
MKKILLILFSLALFQSKPFCQTNISGIVNVYPAVLSYDSCNNNCMNVNSSVGFTIGDHVMVIQMKGMEINQTNTASFGSFVAYDSVGFYERAIILSISGNNICFTSDLAYKYKASGKIQLVKIARYPLGVNVVGTVQALAWDGSIIVFQKSIDGQTFEDLLTISVNDFNPKGNFEAIDREPSIGKSFYRVKIVNNKKEQYLSDVYYFYNGLNWTEEDILVYPNPVLQNQKLTIEFPTTQHKMTLKVMDITGRILYDTKLTEEQTSTGHIEIDKYSNTSNKMLILQLSSDKGEVFTKKIIIIQ